MAADVKATHHTIGWAFRAGGAVYRCTHWTPAGYWMRVEAGRDAILGREVGDMTCVSERAIGRTFHLDVSIDHAEPHNPACECGLCRTEVRRG